MSNVYNVYNAAGAEADPNAKHNPNTNPDPTRTGLWNESYSSN